MAKPLFRLQAESLDSRAGKHRIVLKPRLQVMTSAVLEYLSMSKGKAGPTSAPPQNGGLIPVAASPGGNVFTAQGPTLLKLWPTSILPPSCIANNLPAPTRHGHSRLPPDQPIDCATRSPPTPREMALLVSPAKLVLLAVHCAVNGDITSLTSLAARHPAVLRKDLLPERLRSVLAVLYLVFNEGYSASTGDEAIRRELCDEAIRLAALVPAAEYGSIEVRPVMVFEPAEAAG